MSTGQIPTAGLAAPPRRRVVAQCAWIFLATIFAIAGPAMLILFWTFFASVSLGDLLLLLMWGAAAVVALGFALWSAHRGRWHAAIATAMLPLSLVISLLNLGALWQFSMGAGEAIHFRLARRSYLSEIAALPANERPRLAVFVLSEDGWLGISNLHLVVYDESDEVALPEERRSAAWKKRAARTPLQFGIGYLRPLGDHFYIVRISY